MKDHEYRKYLNQNFPDAKFGMKVKFQGWAIGESFWVKMSDRWERYVVPSERDK